jgi:folate-binding protein YgfZ
VPTPPRFEARFPGYQALRERAAWVALPRRTCLLVRGKDAVRFVDNFTTAAVSRLAVGEGCEGFFTDARGWVIALAHILRTDTGLWIDAPPGLAPRLREHLEHYRIREDVEFVDASADRAAVLVAGPATPGWLAARGVPPPARLLDHIAARPGGVPATVVRVDWCGPEGFLVQVDAGDGPRLAEWLASESLPVAGPAEYEAARIEEGTPDQGDIPEKTLPQELDRNDRAISFTKGCYLGQETVARIDAVGHVNRTLVGLATPHPVAVGAEVRSHGEAAGRITSACYSPRLGAGLAMAIVPRKTLAVGGLEIDGIEPRVVPLPVEPAAATAVDGGTAAENVLFSARRFRVIRLEQPCADGSVREREVVVHPGSVVVVPLVAADRVCLIEVVRVAVGQTLVELPAGTLDREESLAEAAARELAEETGYRAGRIEAAGSFWMSPGILRERMHLFIASDLEAGPQALEPGEQIRTRVVDWAEAVAMCLDGRIEDAKTIAGILLLDARRTVPG